MDNDDLSPDDADLELLRQSEANKLLFELFRRLVAPSELIEDFLGEHGEGHGCYFCSCGKAPMGRIVELLFGLRWALSMAAAELEEVTLAVPRDDAKERDAAPVVRLKPFSALNQTERVTL